MADYAAYVPSKTYGMVECVHQVLLHLWLDQYMGIYEWERDDYQNMNSQRIYAIENEQDKDCHCWIW